MDTLPDTTGILEAARRYAELGLPIIPLDGKVPAVAGWQQFVADAVNVRLWFGQRGCNVGLRTGESGYVVIDADTDEAERWVSDHCAETPLRVRSGGGSTHRYYANPPRKQIRNRQGLHRIHGLDVRGQGGYIVLPPSIHPETGKRYEWLTEFRLPEGLPRFSPAWVYERTRRRLSSIDVVDDADQRARRARAYIATIFSISGQNGHNSCYRAVCKLRDFGLSATEAWPVLVAWNETNARPPWSEAELRHKVESVYGK